MELDKIISILIRNSYITAFELNKIGYIDEDITELINDGYLRRKERGVYVIGNLDTLVSYAQSIKERKPEFSKEIIDYCNLLKGIDIKPYYEKLEQAIQDKNSFDIINNYKLIDSVLSKDEEKAKTSNFYLLLLSLLYDMPDEYKNRIEGMKIEEIHVNGNNDLIELENILREHIYFRAFHEAKRIFKKRVSMQDKFNLEDKIEKDLIYAVIEKYNDLKKEIIQLIEKNKFKKLLEVLNKEDERNFLNVKSSFLLKTVINYLDIEKSKKVPVVKENSGSTFNAINNNDYRKALEYMENYRTSKNINYDDTLYMMLIKINELIETINKLNEEIIEKVVEEEPKKIVKDESKQIKEKKKEVKENKSSVGKSVLVNDISKNKEDRKEVPIMKKEVVLEPKDLKRIDSYVQEIYAGKLMIILDKIDPAKNDLVIEELKKYREITEFKIGKKDKERVVVCSRPYMQEKYKIGDLVKEARKYLYDERNYNKAEELFRLLLQIGNPTPKIYGEYGITLLKLHRRRESIPYLKVATELSREKGLNLDYSDLILNIDGTIKKSEAKPVVRMSEKDFCEDKMFGLNLDYLNDLIVLVQQGEFDLEEAMNGLGLDEYNKNYIRLICARDCYYTKDYKNGDKYLKRVEHSTSKNDLIKRVYNEVLVNRKYYKNRLEKEENQLVFRK